MDSNELKAEVIIRSPRLPAPIQVLLFHCIVPNASETIGALWARTATALTAVGMSDHKVGRLWTFSREEVDGWVKSGGANEREERKGDRS